MRVQSLSKAYLADICDTVFFEKKIRVVSSVNMALNWRSSLYTSLFDIGCIPNSTTDTRSETDKRALIFNESLTWGLPVKIHKNQLVKNLCLRMRVQSLSKAYLVDICGTVFFEKKSTSGFKC